MLNTLCILVFCFDFGGTIINTSGYVFEAEYRSKRKLFYGFFGYSPHRVDTRLRPWVLGCCSLVCTR